MSGILQNVLTPLIRIFRLSKFDQNVFGEIRDDSSGKLITSITIIVVSSLLAGLGSFLYWEISGNPVVENQFINTFIFGSLFMALLYIEGLLVTFVLLVQVFRIPVDLHALLCVGGYASFPLGLSLIHI